MRSYILTMLFLYIMAISSYLQAQCGGAITPLVGTSNLAKTHRPLKEMFGINAGYEVERFVPGPTNNSLIPLDSLKGVCSFIRFFYQQDKDYDNNHNPNEVTLGNLSRTQLLDTVTCTYFCDNYVRIRQVHTAGLKVHVAMANPAHGVNKFPNFWWTAKELGGDPVDINLVRNKGADWATAFLKVYDPKNSNGSFQWVEPLVAKLELGNEPWGDPGIETYRYYVLGILDAFKAYYGSGTFRIQLAGAAYQAHEAAGTTFSFKYGDPPPQEREHLFDYVGDMIGGSLLSELRDNLKGGVGVHNYNFDDYSVINVDKILTNPEDANGGFSFYKNMSEWVNNNMPAGNKKLNATEFGWNSDSEPSRIFQDTTYATVIGLNYPGCSNDFGACGSSFHTKSGIGRTAQSAYLIRSLLMLSRWGANEAVAYNLMDDWTNASYYSNGLVDATKPTTYQQYQQMGTESNPYERKESWYAIKKLNQVLGDKYYLTQYGSETDGGIYCYLYGADVGNHEATPTHLVVWCAKQIDPQTIPGVQKNDTNDNANIAVVRNATLQLNLGTLGIPANFTINTAGKATYLDGNMVLPQVDVSGIFSNGDITVSPIPLVIPINVSGGCTVNYETGEMVNCNSNNGLGNQTIDFAVISDKLTTDLPFSINATASSNLPVSFQVIYGPATITGNTVTLTGAGTVTIRATQVGNAQWNPAFNVDRSFNVTHGSGEIDLKLNLQQLTANPGIYSDYQVRAIVTNTGPIKATCVRILFNKPANVVYHGGQEYTASQGSSFNFLTDEIWSIGEIPAGASDTLTVEYFLNQNGAPAAYAQVISTNETDKDSQPNNGTPPTLHEDDEASTANIVNPCSPDGIPPVISGCPANITQATTGSSAIATWIAPTASDNCTFAPVLTSNYSSGASFPVNVTTTVTYLAKDADNNTATCTFTVTVTQQQPASQIDLSLTLEQLTANPTIWTNYSTKATVTNAGPQAATGVKVRFPKPNGVAYVGGNEYIASQGSFASGGDEAWTVGSIPAGGSATLTVNYFLMQNSSPAAYAQVTAADQADGDSQPNNGTPPTPVQDDEASTVSSPCSPDVTAPVLGGCPANIALTTTGGTATATWTPPTAADNCTATTLTASHSPGASFPLGATTVTYTAKDAANNTATCTFTVTVTVTQQPASQIDLSLTLEQLTANPAQWGYYSVKATVTNAGPQPATGVKVRFPKPNGVAYGAPNQGAVFTASQGTFEYSSDEVWTVGSIQANNSATLTVNYYLLNPTAPAAYAQVTAADQADGDSQPNNGTPPTPVQDDEASTSGNNAIKIDFDRRRVSFERIYPNPATYEINMEIYSPIDQTTVLDFYDNTSRPVARKEVSLQAGKNIIPIEVWEWKSGSYYIIARGEGLPAYGRFLKVWEE